MVGNLKVFDKLVDKVKEHPKEAVIIVSTGVLIAGLILSNIPSKPKEEFPFMPAPTPTVTTIVETPKPTKNPNYITIDIKVAQNQIMRLEPRSDSKYVNKVEGNNDAELLYIDGNYALISYNDNGNVRLGYVEADRISHLEDIGPNYQATKLNMYGEIKNDNCRIQNNTDDNYDDPNILTRGKKGEYVKIVGTIHDGEKDWYIVIYRNYIGYIDPSNLNVMDEEAFFNMVNTTCVEIVGSKVRFRRSPKIDKKNIITELDKGTKLPVISREGDWYQVYYNGEYGYVSTRSDCTKEIFEVYAPPGLTQIHLEKENGMII